MEPSKEQQCQAREFQQRMRMNGFLIVYSQEKNAAELVSMDPRVLKQQAIQQKRLKAEDKATFTRLKDVLSIECERAFLTQGLTKAQSERCKDPRDKPLDVFNESIRVFPGARFVERVQGHFINETAVRPNGT